MRGNSSLQECSFAKLSMKIPKDPSQPDRDLGPFAGDTKLKIGTHCGEDPTGKGRIGRLRHELATHRESAVYQLLGALLDGTADEPALHTRAARITWVDTTGGEGGGASAPLERDAFLLEAADRLAGRLGAPKHCRAVPGEDAEVCDPVLEDVEVADVEASSLDEAHVAQLATFHAMVGNWDWSLGRVGSSSGKGLRNTDVLVRRRDGAPPRLVPVAQTSTRHRRHRAPPRRRRAARSRRARGDGVGGARRARRGRLAFRAGRRARPRARAARRARGHAREGARGRRGPCLAGGAPRRVLRGARPPVAPAPGYGSKTRPTRSTSTASPSVVE